MNIYNQPMISNVVMNAAYNSQPQQLLNMIGFSIQCYFTGTPTGTFKLQSSSDSAQIQPPTNRGPTNWTDITGSSQAVSAAGNITWNYNGVFFNWVRIVYTDSSGGTSTAVMSATFNGKGF